MNLCFNLSQITEITNINKDEYILIKLKHIILCLFIKCLLVWKS